MSHVAMVPHEGFYILCDIGHSKTNIVIMEGKELRYARTIAVAGLHFTRTIQRAFNLNYDKAESLKIARGKVFIREQDSDQVSRALSKVAGELVSAIKQTVLAAGNTLGSISIPAIYCCGGSSKMAGILDYLSFHLRANVFELDALTYINHEFESPDDINKVIPQALSSALRPIYSNRLPKINFRKGQYAFKQDIQFITKEFKSVGVLLLMIFFLGIGYYFYADYHYAERMASVDKQVESIIEKEFSEISLSRPGKKRNKTRPLKRYLRSAKAKLTEFKNQAPAIGEKRKVVNIMYSLSEALPAKKDVSFEITEFNFSDDFLRLNSRTDDPLNVEKVVASLTKSGKFGEIEAGDPQAKPGNMWDFVLKINLP